jgi:APA family basic amino acid/polyamine antiporter
MVKTKKLKKELGLFDVYAIATGTTLSAGFFLMPGLAASEVGSAMILSYLIATIPLIPAMFCIVELTTAMPRSGGVYFFLDRTLGPYFGTIGGIGTWLALILKVCFALIGMGAYVALFFPSFPIVPTAIIIALLLGGVNLFGAKKTGKLQQILVIILLTLLSFFIGDGLTSLNYAHFKDLFNAESSAVISTAGLVYISYVGITKVASLAEEVKDPERNLPLGVFLAMGTSVLVYALGTTVMVGVIPPEELVGTLTPVALAAEYLFGYTGKILLSIAALSAFISVANAGIMSASRYPLAMSRDHIIPSQFRNVTKNGIPINAILLTVGTIIAILVFLNPLKIAKLASAFQLLIFALVCFAVIIMRESRIDSYDPGYKSPLYPWLHILGILIPLYFITQMGVFPLVFSIGLIVGATFWYIYYTRQRVERNGAIYHIFERLGKQRYNGLDIELREILKEKGLREEDPFNLIVARSHFVDADESMKFEGVVKEASKYFSTFTDYSLSELEKLFLGGTLIGATPVSKGVALPHLRVKGLKHPEMVLVRSKSPISITVKNILDSEHDDVHEVNAIFFLISPDNKPRQHLRILAKLAENVEKENFYEHWRTLETKQDLKQLLLKDERCISLKIENNHKTSPLIGLKIKEIKIPENCFIALLQRGTELSSPDEKTIMEDGDCLTIIGNPDSMNILQENYL